MKRLVSIDPGLNHCGVAIWGDVTTLLEAFLVKNSSVGSLCMCDSIAHAANAGLWADKLVIELPQIYVRSRSKGDPNDLIDLAELVGQIRHLFSSRGTPRIWNSTVLPATWKGQVPKNVMVNRIKNKLSVEERSAVRLPSASLAHNVWDAVGIGLHHLGRL